MPTLPQRDIYERVARPILRKKDVSAFRKKQKKFTDIQEKDVEKLLRLKQATEHPKQEIHRGSYAHIDLHSVKPGNARYSKIPEKHLHYLLSQPNEVRMASLRPSDVTLLRKLKALIGRKRSISFDEFSVSLYDIPKKKGARKVLNKANQRRFFSGVYQLLFGKEYGPQLAPFLWETEKEDIERLFRVQ